MANNNIEIEIKVPVDKSLFLEVKSKLGKIARFEKDVKQKDDYFTPVHRSFTAPEFPYEWLSIRKRDGKCIVNYKHFYPENVEVTAYCDEFETEIGNAGGVEKMFSALNFKKLVSVEKEREVFVFKDMFEIALDNVKGLGYFIEIEAVKDLGSVENARKEIAEFAKTLGVEGSKADKRGYPFLLMEKKGLIKNLK